MFFVLLLVGGPSLCLAVTRVEVVKSWSAVVTEVSKFILIVLFFVLLQSVFCANQHVITIQIIFKVTFFEELLQNLSKGQGIFGLLKKRLPEVHLSPTNLVSLQSERLPYFKLGHLINFNLRFTFFMTFLFKTFSF